jgi:predicted acyl esterase
LKYLNILKGKTEVHKAALDSDVPVEHDVEIAVRDGAPSYVDFYRSADFHEKIPAILSWLYHAKKYNALGILSIRAWRC